MHYFIWCLFALSGFLNGRLYQWAKFRNPEFKEELAVRIAELRLDRKRVELEEAKIQAEEDEIYEKAVN